MIWSARRQILAPPLPPRESGGSRTVRLLRRFAFPAKAMACGAAAAFLGALALPSSAAPRLEEDFGPYSASLSRVIDGDTVELDVVLWPGLVMRTSLRLAGVNTPELHGPGVSPCEKAAAADAAAFTARIVGQGGRIEVTGIRLDKYAGRVLGRLMVDGRDLAEALLSAGLAKPYSGGRRDPWC